MKTWKAVLLTSAIIIGLPVIGIAAILALGLCKATAEADRMNRKFNPPPHDYEK